MASRGRVRQRDHHFDIVCSQRPRRLSNPYSAPHRLLCHPSDRRAADKRCAAFDRAHNVRPLRGRCRFTTTVTMIRGIYGNARELPPRRHWLRITGDRNVARLRVGSFDATSRRIKCRLQCVRERPRASRVRFGGDITSALRLGSSSVLRSIVGGLPCAGMREGHLPLINDCIVNMLPRTINTRWDIGSKAYRVGCGSHNRPRVRGALPRNGATIARRARESPHTPLIAPMGAVVATIGEPDRGNGGR
jgi:hypothetical protein